LTRSSCHIFSALGCRSVVVRLHFNTRSSRVSTHRYLKYSVSPSCWHRVSGDVSCIKNENRARNGNDGKKGRAIRDSYADRHVIST
jgi:hypothetical protein